MNVKNNFRAALAKQVCDYRSGEIQPLDEAHVDRWICQFPASVRDPILKELIHVFNKTYFSRKKFNTFIDSMVTDPNFVIPDANAFWQGVEILDLQTAGNSQKDMIVMLDNSLQRQCGLSLANCGQSPHTYLYLDDALFSGGRIVSDIVTWIKGPAPSNINLIVTVIASHAYGEWDAQQKIKKAADAEGKIVSLTFRRGAVFENRKTYIASSDVLCPTKVDGNEAAEAYFNSLGSGVLLRPSGGKSPMDVFSGEAGRTTLEQEFLTAGVGVREMCPYFDKYMRPLGRFLFNSLGFGSTIVTYRNCPNNAPLVLWAGDPWYPLFPRKTN